MRITTWNVNGIRNPFGYQSWNSARTFPAMFDILEADIVIMQELKIQRKDLHDDMVLLDGWDCYFSLPKHKKGYSGVGIYTRNETCAPIRAEEGILGVLAPPGSSVSFRDLPEYQHIGGYPSEQQIAELGVDPLQLDSEGRCVCLEFPAFVLFGVYSPANSNGLRDDLPYGFLCALDCRIRNLIKAGKQVILCGDLNVSRCEDDTASAIEDMRKAGIIHEEYISTPNRRVFNQLLVDGEVVGERDEGRETGVLHDLSREFHPERKGMFTHWEQKINARPGNFGSRIDFVLVSAGLREWFVKSDIQEGLMGSDHCPVYGVMKHALTHDDQEKSLLDIMSPAGVFVDGERRKQWSVKDIPAMSGKLLPEFDKRRSIKEMFAKPALSRAASAVDAEVNTITPSTLSQHKDVKRKSIEVTAPVAIKRTKLSASPAKQNESTKGQKSLKGFFAPKTSLPAKHPAPLSSSHHDSSTGSSSAFDVSAATLTNEAQHSTATDPLVSIPTSLISQPSACIAPPPSQPPASSPPSQPTAATLTAPPCDSSTTVHDPIASKESWSSLFTKPAAPLCEGHAEPCKIMLTKKKGENQGRSFWMCVRPLGPSGNKEKGTQWRCKTFIWSSDVKSE